MPEEGSYLLVDVGFSKEKQPYATFLKDDAFVTLFPLGQTMTLTFDTAQHFCSGWRDIATGERFPCPDRHIVDPKYEQCPACQNRTGFNPAFYHATSISKQQEERNLKPHFLYLAHFGKGIVKVGISFAARGHGRLLEQGARAALILDTFPSAHIARQYEAEIARLPGIVETLQLRKKTDLAAIPYDTHHASRELLGVKEIIEKTLGKTFVSSEILTFDQHFFPSNTPDLSNSFDCTAYNLVSGTSIGALGSLFFFHQQDTPLFLPLKKYIGYQVALSYSERQIELPARQTSLF